jgi:hypothetical protein
MLTPHSPDGVRALRAGAAPVRMRVVSRAAEAAPVRIGADVAPARRAAPSAVRTGPRVPGRVPTT